MATNDEVDNVVTNMNNEGIELDDVEKKESPGVNGHAKANETTITLHGGKDPEPKPLLPKIFIALLVVLLIAVIALSFVLYRLDKDISINKKGLFKTSGLSNELRITVKDVKDLKKDLGDELNRIKNLTTLEKRLTGTIEEIKKDATSLKGRVGEDEGKSKATFQNIDEKIKDNTASITSTKDDLIKDINSVKGKVSTNDGNIKKEKENINRLEVKINDVSTKEDKNSKDLLELSRGVATIKANFDKEISKSNEAIKGNSKAISDANNAINIIKKEEKDRDGKINLLTSGVKENKDNITSVKKEASTIKGSVVINSNNNKELKEFVDQLHLHMEFKPKDTGMTYAELLKKLGKKSVVDEPRALTELVKQKTEFSTKTGKWGISDYNIILNFTDESELKEGKSLTTIKKVDAIFSGYDKYKAVWGITFPAIIKLTTKEDIKAINLEVVNEVKIPVLEKISRMFQLFNTSYKEVWGIEFKDVFALTKDLKFKVADTTIPILEKINSWCVANLTTVYGEGSFKKLFKVIKDVDDIDRKVLVGKLDSTVKKGTLKFLPGDFELNGKILTVSGFVEVFLGTIKTIVYNKWGTIKAANVYGDAPNVLCMYTGYESGATLKSHKTDFDIDRKNMTTLLKTILCESGTKDINDCSTFDVQNNNYTSKAWDHKLDAILKCNF